MAEAIQRLDSAGEHARFSKASKMAIEVGEEAWHSLPSNEAVLKEIGSSMQGLTTEEAAKRLAM